MRRAFVFAVMLGVCPLSLPAAEPPEMQVILLGTGYPRPDPEHAGPATAVLVGEKLFVVDAGRGVVLRLAALDLPPSCGVVGSRCLAAVFLTHLHSDHTAGLPDLFTTSWIFGRAAPLEFYGPAGTREMAAALEKYFAEDIRIRRDLTEMLPAAGATLNVHQVVQGVMYEDEAVRVTAFAVDHRPVEPAFGYRFDFFAPSSADESYPQDSSSALPFRQGTASAVPNDDKERRAFRSGAQTPRFLRGDPELGQPPSPARRIVKTVVISGDTRPSDNLIKFARGADVLIHEAYLPEHFDDVDSPAVAARLKRYHTSADEVGQVAAAAGVKLLVLTHVIPGDPESEKIFLERARKHFKGEIVVGKDLMRF